MPVIAGVDDDMSTEVTPTRAIISGNRHIPWGDADTGGY